MPDMEPATLTAPTRAPRRGLSLFAGRIDRLAPARAIPTRLRPALPGTDDLIGPGTARSRSPSDALPACAGSLPRTCGDTTGDGGFDRQDPDPLTDSFAPAASPLSPACSATWIAPARLTPMPPRTGAGCRSLHAPLAPSFITRPGRTTAPVSPAARSRPPASGATAGTDISAFRPEAH